MTNSKSKGKSNRNKKGKTNQKGWGGVNEKDLECERKSESKMGIEGENEKGIEMAIEFQNSEGAISIENRKDRLFKPILKEEVQQYHFPKMFGSKKAFVFCYRSMLFATLEEQ